MISRRSLVGLAITLLALCINYAYAQTTEKSAASNIDVGGLSTREIEQQLQQCPILLSLAAHQAATHPPTSSTLQKVFSILFPGSPAVNSLLATLYISGPPNFLLALCPPNIDPANLSIMVAFAVGGLLGDTLFHLLPEIFLGEVPEGQVRAVVVEPNKNLLLGVAIMVGFVTFVAMDKGLRIATGGEGHTHNHNGDDDKQPNGHATNDILAKGSTTGSFPNNNNADLKQRTRAVASPPQPPPPPPPKKDISQSVRLSAYLNLIADFTHNITDGLALSSSFYASPTIGATTTLAVFCHEIPHEVGDFALLIQSGFSKRMAMGAQFVTALGALLGTAIGVAVQEFGRSSGGESGGAGAGVAGLWGTSLQAGDLLLPFTAGTFLYVGTVAVIPELLETGPDRMKELRSTVAQFAAMAVGAGIMLGISWS